MDQVRQQGEGTEQPKNQEAALPGVEQAQVPEAPYAPLEDLQQAEQPTQPEHQSAAQESTAPDAVVAAQPMPREAVPSVGTTPVAPTPAETDTNPPVAEITDGERGAILSAGKFELDHTGNAGKTSETLGQVA